MASLLVVYYLLGTGYLKQRSENEALTSQLADTKQALKQIPEPPADLKQRLAAANSRLDAARKYFPDMMSSTRIINNILRLAEESEVKAIPIVTQAWTTEPLNADSYSVFRIHIAVTGTFTQLVGFVDKLENGELKTLVMENIRVTRAAEEPRGDSPEGTTAVNADLNVAIYTRSPNSE